MKHVVIIGGGFGGLTAARALHRAPVRISLIDRNNYHLFQPLLYQVATAGLSPGDIASPIRWILRRQRNVQTVLAQAQGVDLGKRRVLLQEGSLDYDYLIIATGADHSYFGHGDWRQYAPPLKDLTDALEIRRRVLLAFEKAEQEENPDERRRYLTFVIVGGGPTGVELAGALAEIARHSLSRDFRSITPMSARIFLLEATPEILMSFPQELRRSAEKALARLGVLIRKGAPVTAITDDSVTAGGEVIATRTVLWAAGVAASPFVHALASPLDRAGRVLVTPSLAIPGHPEIFVIGDSAAFHRVDGSFLPGVAQVAIQMGEHAARNIRRSLAGKEPEPFRYRDLGNLATIGRAAAIADFGWLRLSGWIAWMAWLLIHLMKLVGFRNRVLVFVQWAWAYCTYQRSVRLIIDRTEK
jgi:NADH dehydrogenase